MKLGRIEQAKNIISEFNEICALGKALEFAIKQNMLLLEAEILFVEKDYIKAISKVEEQLKYYPEWWDANSLLVKFLFSQKKYSKIINILKIFRSPDVIGKTNFDVIELYEFRAKAYEAMNQQNKANEIKNKIKLLKQNSTSNNK